MTSSTLVSLACLGLCLIFFVYCRSYLKRRTGQERILEEFRDEVNGILAEIDDKTDRDAQLVEARIKRLHTVLEEADKRIALYVRELDRRDGQAQAYAELGKNRLRFTTPLPSAPAAAAVKIPAPEGGETATEPPAAPPEAPSLRPRFTQAPREIPPRPRPAAEQAAEMARAGLSPPLIASRLGISISEVEMAVAIAERKGPR